MLQPRGKVRLANVSLLRMILPMDNTLHLHPKLVLEETHTISFQSGVFLSADASSFISSLALLSHRECSATLTAGSGPAPWCPQRLTGLYPVPPCSHGEGGWRSCHSHSCTSSLRQHPEWDQGCMRGCKYHPANTERREGFTSLLHLCVCCLHVIPILPRLGDSLQQGCVKVN